MENQKMFGRKESVVLNARTFKEFSGTSVEEKMTVRGTVIKTAFLLVLVSASAALTWSMVDHTTGIVGNYPWLLLISAGLIVGLITSSDWKRARYTAPIYALLEGSVLGAISGMVEAYYPGIVIQTIMLTFGTLFSLLLIYTMTGFKVKRWFWVGVLAGLVSILAVYVVNVLLQLFGVNEFPFLHQTGLVGILFNLYVVFIAALNLIMDFHIIESGVDEGAPVHMEWYAAYGLMVTLVWLYLEVLELLLRIAASSSDDS